tara:strand:+ start:90 stop:2054 length:1965 start_codon:yes stop_codon:yes gene_type:complete
MKFFQSLIIITTVLLVSCQVNIAQNSAVSSSDRKAVKLFEEAKVQYQNYQLSESISSLKEALDRDPNFVEAYTLMGYVYIDLKDKDKALSAFESALSVNPRFSSNTVFFVGQLQLELGEYQKAERALQEFMKFPVADTKLRAEAQNKLDGLAFALEAIKQPVPFNPINLGSGVNSSLPEYFPSITVDGSTLLYTRQLPAPNTPAKYNEDFYVSQLQDGIWGMSQDVGAPINTENNEGAPSLSADGKLLIFTACELYGDYGGGRKGLGSCDLFFSQRQGNKWSAPQNLGDEINSRSWETQPSFSADGKTLYYVKRVKNKSGYAHSDIYVSEVGKDGYWKTPVALPGHINTQKNEESVFIHPDGQTLYFSSDGHAGMGGLDIYVTRMNEKGEWSVPKNLGYPINTHVNENSILISPDGNKAYFASDRDGGFGGLDLYEFELPKSIQPNRVSYLAGKVIDAETRKPLSSQFELLNLENSQTVISSLSDPVDGSFLVALPLSKNYALNVSKPGYLFYSENFTVQESINQEPYRKNIELQRIKVGERVVLKNIFYATNEFALLDDSKAELAKLVEFLVNNSAVSIEIEGHTDNVGSAELNKTLSINRAKKVYEFLITEGIPKERLSFTGFGSEEPVASNDSELGRRQNRRTAFKVTKIN